MKKVSVIITVYNTEKYLNKCLDSLVNQTYENIEIILVNDGSIDNSEKICLSYAKEYKNIYYFYQDNQGQQSAQYNGLKKATGDYVLFVDADDWIENNMIADMLGMFGDVDMITSGYIAENMAGTTKRKVCDAIEEGAYFAKEGYEYILNNFFIYKHERTKGLLNNKACKIFKRDKALRAMEMSNMGISIEEDFLFVFCYLMLAESIYVSHNCYYHYLQNENSISHSFVEHYLSERELVYDKVISTLINFGHEKLVPEYQKRFYYDIVRSLPSYMKFENINTAVLNYYPLMMETLKGKKIAIYGFGQRGIALYKWLHLEFKEIDLVGIIDIGKFGEKYDDYVIKDLDKDLLEACDYVIITMVDDNACLNVKERLNERGVDDSRIIKLATKDLLAIFL